MKVEPRDDDFNIIGVNPLSIESLNMDFDGDTSALYMVHDKKALEQMYNNAFIQNVVQYDPNNNFLSVIRHEALYAAYILTSTDKNECVLGKFTSIRDIPESIELFNNLGQIINIDNNSYTYGVCLFNKWCGFDDIKFTKPITKKEIHDISRRIYENSNDSKAYYDQLHDLEKKLMFFITIIDDIPTLSLYEMISLVDDETHKLIRKMPNQNAYVSYHINNALIDRCVEHFPKSAGLYKLFKSGSRFNKTQLSHSCITIGLLANEINKVQQEPIKTSLIEGLTPEEFFASAPGTRKGLIDKDRSVPESGYLERTLSMALSAIEIAEDDCKCTDGLHTSVINKDHLKMLIGKYYKLNESDEWQLFTGDEVNLIDHEIILRSPMTCATKNYKICKKCFGEKKIRTKYVGITSAQVITERLTQLLLRTFHTSGSCDLEINQNVSNFIKDYLVDIKEVNKQSYLYFSSDEVPVNDFETIPGYSGVEKNVVKFDPILTDVFNQDTLALVNNIKELLKKNNKINKTPNEYYENFIKCVGEVGGLYSSFVELVLAHIFLTRDGKIWRYDQGNEAISKLSDKTIAKKISPLLSFLYTPNKSTIDVITDDDLFDINKPNLSLHEKIFLNKFN